MVSLGENLKIYFLPESDMSRFDWIQNQFHVEVEKVCHLTLKAQKEFAELSSDSSLKTMFAKMSLNSFWVGTKLEYPNLSRLAMDTLLPSASTYLCESAFSSLTNLNKTSIESSRRAVRASE